MKWPLPRKPLPLWSKHHLQNQSKQILHCFYILLQSKPLCSPVDLWNSGMCDWLRSSSASESDTVITFTLNIRSMWIWAKLKKGGYIHFWMADGGSRKVGNRPLGSSSGVTSGSLGGSGMLQSVPAQVVSQVHVASLLHTCAQQTYRGKQNERWSFFKFPSRNFFSSIFPQHYTKKSGIGFDVW